MVINSPDGLIYVQNWVNRKGFINKKIFFQSIARTPRQYLGESEHNHIFCILCHSLHSTNCPDGGCAIKFECPAIYIVNEFFFSCFRATFFHNIYFFIYANFLLPCDRKAVVDWRIMYTSLNLSFTWCDIYSYMICNLNWKKSSIFSK